MALDAHAQRGLPPGSLQWYAVLFTTGRERAALTALYAIDAELQELLSARIEHDVAHVKLAWWHAEIERLAQGQPLHPLTRTLHANSSPLANAALLHDTLTAVEYDLAGRVYPTLGDLGAYLGGSAALQALAAQLVSPTTADPERVKTFGELLGRGLRLCEMVRDVALDHRRGQLYVPLQLLNDERLAPELLLDAAHRDTLSVCLQSLCADARRLLTEARSALTPTERPIQRHGLVLAELCLQQLRHLERRGLVNFEGTRELPPLRRLWHAWRAARQS